MTKEEAERLAREWLSERWVLTALELEERDIDSLTALLLRVAGEALNDAANIAHAEAIGRHEFSDDRGWASAFYIESAIRARAASSGEKEGAK